VTYTSIRWNYGVARISSILKITGLFCKRALQKRRYSAKDVFVTYNNVHWNPYLHHESHTRAYLCFCKRALQKRRYSAKDVLVTYNSVHWNPYLNHETHTRAYLCRNHIRELDERIAANVPSNTSFCDKY